MKIFVAFVGFWVCGSVCYEEMDIELIETRRVWCFCLLGVVVRV